MKRANYPQIFLATLLIAIAGGIEAAPEEIEVCRLSAAKPIERPAPEYPFKEARLGNEGWADFQYRVNLDGSVSEIKLVDHSGREEFAEAAKKAIEKYRYKPAQLDGMPIDSFTEIRVTFMLEGGTDGATSRFYRAYRKFSRAIEKGEMAKALTYLDRLRDVKSMNLYEDAYLNLSEYLYLEATNSPLDDRIGFLRRALGRGTVSPYLPKTAWVAGQQALIAAHIKQKDYATALLRINDIPQEKWTESLIALVAPIKQQILDLRAGDRPYIRSAVLDSSGAFELRLLRNRLSIDVRSGRVESIEFYCDYYRATLGYAANADYQIPESHGSCLVTVTGQPGSEITLIQ